jgi:hypothetical protein
MIFNRKLLRIEIILLGDFVVDLTIERTSADVWNTGGYAPEIAGTAKSTDPGHAVAASGDAVCANQ